MPQVEISIYSLLLAVGSIQAAFLFLTLLTSADKGNSANPILAGLMALFAYDLLDEFMQQTWYILSIPDLAMFIHGTDLAYGPVIYLYTRRITDDTFARTNWLHLFPAATALLVIIYLTLTCETQQFIDYLLEKDNTLFALEITDFVITIGGLASMVVYIILSLRLLSRHQKLIGANFSYTESIDLIWLRNVLITLTLLILFYFGWFFSVVFMDGKYGVFEQLLYMGMVITIFFLGFKGIRQPQIFAGGSRLYHPQEDAEADESSIESESSPEKEVGLSSNYQSSAVDADESAMIFNEVQKTLLDQKLFLEPKLSLADLAEYSGFKIHYISQAINQNQKQNFFEFINHYRIEYARALLSQNLEDSVNILQIAMESGFNSKSSFYNAFKKHCGQTPTQYRKSQQMSPDL